MSEQTALKWLDDIEECVIAIRDGSKTGLSKRRLRNGLGDYYPAPEAPLRNLQEALDQIEAARVALTTSKGDCDCHDGLVFADCPIHSEGSDDAV